MNQPLENTKSIASEVAELLERTRDMSENLRDRAKDILHSIALPNDAVCASAKDTPPPRVYPALFDEYRSGLLLIQSDLNTIHTLLDSISL